MPRRDRIGDLVAHIRAYWPEQAVLDGIWVPPKAEKANCFNGPQNSSEGQTLRWPRCACWLPSPTCRQRFDPPQDQPMSQAIGELLPLAVAVALSPVPIIAVILMLATPRARSRSSSSSRR